MTFKEAVEAAQHPVNNSYCSGKQAMENKHRHLVTCQDSKRLTGSIDLDKALEKHRPNDNRWDYGLGYKPANGGEQAIWVEVHSATTREVSKVLSKLQWLKDWLNEDAEQLRRLSDRADGNIRYVWIASSGVKIQRHSRQRKQLALSGLRLKSSLALP